MRSFSSVFSLSVGYFPSPSWWLFTTVWTFGLLFYSLGYNLFLSLFILLYGGSHICPVGAPSSCFCVLSIRPFQHLPPGGFESRMTNAQLWFKTFCCLALVWRINGGGDQLAVGDQLVMVIVVSGFSMRAVLLYFCSLKTYKKISNNFKI